MGIGGVSGSQFRGLEFIEEAKSQVKGSLVLVFSAVVAHDAGDGDVDFLPAVAAFALSYGVIGAGFFRLNLLFIDGGVGRSPGVIGGMSAGVPAGGVGFPVAAPAEDGAARGGIEAFQIGTQIPVEQVPAAAQTAHRLRGVDTRAPEVGMRVAFGGHDRRLHEVFIGVEARL